MSSKKSKKVEVSSSESEVETPVKKSPAKSKKSPAKAKSSPKKSPVKGKSPAKGKSSPVKTKSKSRPKDDSPLTSENEDEEMVDEPPKKTKKEVKKESSEDEASSPEVKKKVDSKKKASKESSSTESTPKKVDKKSSKKAVVDSDSEDDDYPKLSSKSKKLINEKIKKFKDLAEKEDFVAIEDVDPVKMRDRYNWLVNQLKPDYGILSKPNNKKVEGERFFLVGVGKSMKLHYFYPGRPDKDYTTPTEAVRDIYIDNGIDTKSIKGWEQSSSLVKTKKDSKPEWLTSSRVIPLSYRRRKQAASTDASKSKKRSKEAADDDVDEPKKKSSKAASAHKYAKDIEPALAISEEISNDLAENTLRLTLIRGAITVDSKILKSMIHKLNRCLEKRDNATSAEPDEESKEKDGSEIETRTEQIVATSEETLETVAEEMIVEEAPKKSKSGDKSTGQDKKKSKEKKEQVVEETVTEKAEPEEMIESDMI